LRLAAALAALLLLGGCIPRPTPPGPATPPPPLGQPVVPPPPITVDARVFALSGPAQQGALLSGTVPAGTALLLLDGKPVRFAPDGRFIIGFGRDAAPAATLEARLQDGRLLRLPINVAPRHWDISSLPTLYQGTTPSPAYEKIRAAERAQIDAAKAVNADSNGWRQQFRWPASGRISTMFGSQRIYAQGVAGAPHGGLDIARAVGGPVLEGTPARAPADGVIVLASDHPFSLEGNLVMIDHGFGLISALMHLQRIDVKVGDHVSRGQPIGLIGRTGRATGPHLHWGMTWNDVRIDPILLAGPMPAP
jgi:murein DD-endopeptidase MepM/ murein hydrolase activator NlpD